MRVEIKPVTRVEGHLHVYIEIVGGDVEVELRAGGFRGFEKILVGRPIEEAPHIVSRICGVCPVAHHLASVKAIDSLLGIEIPKASKIIREIMGLGGVIQSHLLHLGFLMLPDIGSSQGMEDVYNTYIFRTLIASRSRAVHIVNISGGRHVHPFNAVPGGVIKLPSDQDLGVIESKARDGVKLLSELYGELSERVVRFVEDNAKEIAYRKSAVAALKGDTEGVEFYDGWIRVLDSDGGERVFQPREYTRFVVEEPVPYSYVKRPYIAVDGSRELFRVGPLPRLLLSSNIQYDVSKELYRDFETMNRKWPSHPLLYNLARLIESVYCFERIVDLVDELRNTPMIPRAKTVLREGDGVGVVEAPRGLLIHHYRCDKNGIITYANLIIPTAMNIPVMEHDIRETMKLLIDRYSVDSEYIKRKILNLVRSYDPCISCATHSIYIVKR